MEAFVRHTGIAAPMLHNNIDTDAIIPSAEMKRVSRRGLGEGLFAGWRYLRPGGREPNPEFILNQPGYSSASIILAGSNFGCGSSREHAVWALREFGIRAIIAPSFGSIFQANCVRNGLLPIVLDETLVQSLAAAITGEPAGHPLTIDLEQQTIGLEGHGTTPFPVEASDRHTLLEGLDLIDQTLARASSIEDFEQRDRTARPWIYLANNPGTSGAGPD